MAGVSRTVALHDYLDPLTRAISCVTRTQFIHNYYAAPNASEWYLSLGTTGRANVRTREGNIAITAQFRFGISRILSITRSYIVVQTAYALAIHNGQDQEVVAYHWHPDVGFKAPHLHLGHGAGEIAPSLQKAHLPSGEVDLRDFLLLAIREVGVLPLRPDFAEILSPPPRGE